MINIFYVGIGGFIGAALRYIVSISSTRWFGSGFPYGTLIVNVLGAFFIGAILEISVKSNIISPTMRLFMTTGIMGGLTTFSTFSYETINLLFKGNLILAFSNVGLNVILSLVGVVVGKYSASMLKY